MPGISRVDYVPQYFTRRPVIVDTTSTAVWVCNCDCKCNGCDVTRKFRILQCAQLDLASLVRNLPRPNRRPLMFCKCIYEFTPASGKLDRCGFVIGDKANANALLFFQDRLCIFFTLVDQVTRGFLATRAAIVSLSTIEGFNRAGIENYLIINIGNQYAPST